MPEHNHTLEDLLAYSVDKKPTDFNDSFHAIFLDKLHDRINNKKVEYAKSMFGTKEVEDINLEDEENDEDS